MAQSVDLAGLAAALRDGRGVAAKCDIAAVTRGLGLTGGGTVPVGDDCAAIPDGDGYLLFAIEGFIEAFVAADPWFAGWCGVMVNVSDIAAMGGRPLAVVDALWSAGAPDAEAMARGLRDAAAALGVPIVGGHSNLSASRSQLSVAILGRARKLLTSFDARPGDVLVAAIDLRGRYREPFPNWDAATAAPAGRMRDDLAILPGLAEDGLCLAGKDISQAGLVGTAMMLAECSGVGVEIDPFAVPTPADVPLLRWLQSFLSFGYLLSVVPPFVPDVLARFSGRGIAAAAIGSVTGDRRVELAAGRQRAMVWDFADSPLMRWQHVERVV
jgi:AIR synthase-related protein